MPSFSCSLSATHIDRHPAGVRARAVSCPLLRMRKLHLENSCSFWLFSQGLFGCGHSQVLGNDKMSFALSNLWDHKQKPKTWSWRVCLLNVLKGHELKAQIPRGSAEMWWTLEVFGKPESGLDYYGTLVFSSLLFPVGTWHDLSHHWKPKTMEPSIQSWTLKNH